MGEGEKNKEALQHARAFVYYTNFVDPEKDLDAGERLNAFNAANNFFNKNKLLKEQAIGVATKEVEGKNKDDMEKRTWQKNPLYEGAGQEVEGPPPMPQPYAKSMAAKQERNVAVGSDSAKKAQGQLKPSNKELEAMEKAMMEGVPDKRAANLYNLAKGKDDAHARGVKDAARRIAENMEKGEGMRQRSGAISLPTRQDKSQGR